MEILKSEESCFITADIKIHYFLPIQKARLMGMKFWVCFLFFFLCAYVSVLHISLLELFPGLGK